MHMRNRVIRTALVLLAAGSLRADSGTWTNTAGGNWSEGANWLGGIVASNSGSTASIESGAGTLNNDMADPALALLGLQFAGGAYTLAGNTLTLDSAGFITVLGGSHTVSAPLSLSGNTTLTVASGQALNISGPVSGAGGMTLFGGRTVLGSAGNTYAGPTVLVTGILEVASVAALGTSASDPSNLVLGEGTFRYTGPSATLTRGYTIIPGVSSNRAAVIDIPDAATTLTIAGKAAAPGGSFIKTGDGTLAYTYPGYQEINKSKLANKENGQITYDENGVAATNEYAQFVVEKGRLILGAPGQTNLITTSSGWVGCKTLASPRLDIVGGVTRLINGYFTIGRGTGTAASPQSPSMYINNGAYVTIEGSGLVMDNPQGVSNHRCRPYLEIDGATLRVFNNCFLSEDGNATTTVSVANNGLFQSDQGTQVGGFSISQNAGAKTDVTFANNSTGRVCLARVGRNGTLNVLSGSVFEMDTTPTNAVPQSLNLNLGVVKFNNGTLAQRTAKLVSDWFVGVTNVFVGSGGMTFNVASHAWLEPLVKADPASPGGSLVKTGNGTLVLRPNALNMQVNGGRLAMSTMFQMSTNGTTSTLAAGAGAALELGAAGGAAGLAFSLTGATLYLSPHTLSSNPDLWSFSNSAMRRPDGILQLTPESGNSGAVQNQKGGAFLVRKQAVSSPWTATFSYICWATGADPADGAAFVIQNDPRGVNACGGSGANLGYADTTANKITNSVAVGLNVTGHQIRFGKQGSLVDTRGLPASLPKLGASPVKTKFTVSYDGAGLLTVLIERSGYPVYRYTWPVDVAAEVGASDAYVGFTAGTGGRWGQHSMTDFLFDDGVRISPTYCRYGGRTALGAGETLNASAAPSAKQRGFVVGELAYGDQSVVKVDTASVSSAAPAPTLADQGMWKLNQFANWKPDGRLAVSTNANNSPGSAFTTNLYPVAGSWTARFNYDIGLMSTPPADYITFTVQNLTTNNTAHTPSPGLAIMWRYYDGGVTTTSLRMYTNNVAVLATTNIAPVSLRNGGPAVMTVSHDAAAKTVTVITSQAAGAYTNVFTGVDVATAVGGTTAYLGFGAFTGGLNAENIVSDFSFSSPAMAASGAGYLAFDKLSGSGTLVKRGSAGLGLMGDIDQPTSNCTVRLEKGGLVLHKASAEALSPAAALNDWIFSSSTLWGDDGTLKVCEYKSDFAGTGMTRRRVKVNAPWTATFRFDFGKSTTAPADAFSLFFHNDPSRLGLASGTTVGAGFGSINKSVGLRWCFYPSHSAAYKYMVGYGRNGGWTDASNQSYAPAYLTNGVPTRFAVSYDPAAQTLTSVMMQDAATKTNVFTGINIAADVLDDYAYVGFGSGTGGSYQEIRISDFQMAYDTPTDATAGLNYLNALILPDTSTNTVTLSSTVLDGTYRIAAAAVGDGAAVGVDAAQQTGTLLLSSVTQSGDASYSAASGCTLALSNVVGGATLTKSGAGTVAVAGAVATYLEDTVLSSGTLSLVAPVLPTATDLYVTSGATLNLPFTGKQFIHALYVDGVMMHGGQYTSATAPWITGDGTLVVTFPPSGTLITVK